MKNIVSFPVTFHVFRCETCLLTWSFFGEEIVYHFSLPFFKELLSLSSGLQKFNYEVSNFSEFLIFNSLTSICFLKKILVLG